MLRLALAFYYIGHCVVCMDLAKGNELIARHLMDCHIIMWNRAWVQQWKDGPLAGHKAIGAHLEEKLVTDFPEMATIKRREKQQARLAGRDEGLQNHGITD
jgi:hypothetical protein